MAKLPIRFYKQDEFNSDYDRLPAKAKDRLNAFFRVVADTENKSLEPSYIEDDKGRFSYEFDERCFVYWQIESEAYIVNKRVRSRPVRVQLLDIKQI